VAIPLIKLSIAGPAPKVTVVAGSANRASYTIAMVPPNLDFSKAIGFVVADEPEEVDASHDLPLEWVGRDRWFVVVVGGLGSDSDPAQFSIDAALTQGAGGRKMITTLSKGDAAATFVSSIQIQVQP